MATTNSMVAHKWAHGNAAKSSNFYSPDGKRLISYGTDVAYNTGRGLVFVSDDNMPPSTSKQLCHTRRAVSHLDVIYTPVFHYGGRLYDFNEKQAFNLACTALSAKAEGLSMARLGKYLYSSITNTIEQMVQLDRIAVKYGFDLFAWPVVPAEKIEAARVYAEQWDSKDAARREVRRIKEHAAAAALRDLHAGQFELWHNGGAAECPYSFRRDENGGYYIAVRGDTVVTSGGAECPTEHARRGVEFWLSRNYQERDTLTGSARYTQRWHEWHRNGHTVRLGVFQLDRIEADGTAYAGCHKFTVAELTRLAGVLNV